MAATAQVTDDHLVVPAGLRDPVVVTFDGQYVWSFSPQRDGLRHARGWHVPWPETLRPRLHGTACVRLSDTDGSTLHFEDRVAFGGGTEALRLRDPHGHPLAIDKAGHLTRIFAETGDDVRRHVAEGTLRALTDLRGLGVDAHLSYGCLLGAVRDGRMIGHDSDSDLAYLSAHHHPADVVRESFRMEREMRRLGWKVVRMSGADLKLFLPLPDGRVVHVDVFGAFHLEGTFYQLGGRSGVLPREALTPAADVVLEGVRMPGPADPQAVLAFLYGPGWRVPDPSFQNLDPGAGVRRIEGWFRGARTHLIEWNQVFRTRRGDVPRRRSPFAAWVGRRIPADALVVDLGCGTGRDAGWFVRRRHDVVACDYSGVAMRLTRALLERRGVDRPDVRALAFNDLRAVLLAGAELSRLSQAPYLYGRGLVGCLDADARAQLWLLCSMVLRRGGSLYLEHAAARPGRWGRQLGGLVRRVPTDALVREITRAGGRVVHVEHGPGEGFLGEPDPHVVRLEVRWDRPAGTRTSPPGGSMFEDAVSEAPTTRVRRLARKAMTVPARLRDIEASVQENRRLNRRVAELADVVAELLVPLADRDEERARELLERYRATTLAP